MKISSILLAASVSALVGSGSAVAGGVTSHRSPGSGTLGELKFRFDSAALRPGAPIALDKVAAFASAHPDVKIVLDAYTDPVGASDYNVKLAIRRAEAVSTQLKQMGVAADQIVLAIYGEGGARHVRYADDRRVTVWSTRQPLATVIDRTLARNGTAVTWGRPLTVAQIEGSTDAVASR